MIDRRSGTVKGTGQGTRRAARAALSLAFAGLAAACWLLPVRAQDHRPAPAPEQHAPAARPAPAGEHAPPAAGEHAAPSAGEHAAPATGAVPAREHAPAAPDGEHGSIVDQGEAGRGSHQGMEEHGPGGTHGPLGGEHETGTPAHGEGEHAGEHEEDSFSIHLPTWYYGPLKKFWYSGPATLTAAGALGPGGEPVDPATLRGERIEYVYEDHHFHGTPKPEYHVRPVIGEVGTRATTVGAKTETITVDGREITLIDPTVKFAFESMFPESLFISLTIWLLIVLGAIWLTRDLRRVPTRKQVVAEMIYTKLDDFVHGLIGPHYKKYVPLVGAAFIYIFLMNWGILLPGWGAATANINVTAGMALVVVAYVQYEGIRVNGFKGYVMHFVGEPWWLFWLNVPIHLIGEVAKLLSLSIRLFGNIFGEDVVIVILISLAIMFTKGFVPFHFPMSFLVIFTSFVQAMVFSILTCVYIALMTSHEDHGEHGHGHDHGQIPVHETPASAAA